ncbi:hypothetical protein ARV98_14415, partial [Listeria monocytogenes]|nr:hypothetical protein [Listeria monocytogenes]
RKIKLEWSEGYMSGEKDFDLNAQLKSENNTEVTAASWWMFTIITISKAVSGTYSSSETAKNCSMSSCKKC